MTEVGAQISKTNKEVAESFNTIKIVQVVKAQSLRRLEARRQSTKKKKKKKTW